MPIKDKSRYPVNWENLSWAVRMRAGWRCEGSPAYPDCRATHGESHPVTGSKVILTVAHLDHDPGNNEPDNLRALCQRCHLTHDAQIHALNASVTRLMNHRARRARQAIGDLFENG